MIDKSKIKPPAPGEGFEPSRRVEVPPTVGARDTTQGDDIRLQKTRADWREREFTRALRQHGKHVFWRKALLCPCLNSESEQASLSCVHCNGSGYVYVDPLCIQVHMAQFDKKTNIYEKFGLFQSGTVTITAEAQHRPGYRDSYEMRDDVISFNEILTKNNRRGRRSQLPTGVDSARFRIVDVAAVLINCAKTGKLLQLEPNTHYQVTPEGWLRWTDRGNATVAEGSTFSIHYDYHPIFLIDSWMHVTRNDTSGRNVEPGLRRVVAHPVQALAKLDFLLDVNSVPSLDPIGQPTGIGPSEEILQRA